MGLSTFSYFPLIIKLDRNASYSIGGSEVEYENIGCSDIKILFNEVTFECFDREQYSYYIANDTLKQIDCVNNFLNQDSLQFTMTKQSTKKLHFA